MTPTTRNGVLSIMTVRLAEQVRLELVPQEDHPPAPVDVEVVHVASPGGGDDVAHDREDRAVGRHLGREPHPLPPEGALLALDLPGEGGLGDLPAQHLDVLLGEADPPSLAQTLVGDRGPRGPGDHDVLAEPCLVLADALLQPLAEGHEQGDGDGSPGDAEQGEERPHLLVADVLEHLAQERQGSHEGPRGVRYSIFLGGRSTTRSFSLRPSTTSMFIPSERPTLISLLAGAASPSPGSSTVALPSAKATRRSGTRSTSCFSRTAT